MGSARWNGPSRTALRFTSAAVSCRWEAEGMPRIKTEVRDSAIEARREEFLTVKEYAFMVKQNPDSVRRRIRAGRQPGAVRVGGQWRIDLLEASASRAQRGAA